MHISGWRILCENFVYLALWNYVFLSGNSSHKIHTANSNINAVYLLAALGIILFSMGFYTLFGKYELAKIEHIPILAFGLPILWFVLFVFLHIQNQFHLFAHFILICFCS